MSQSDTSLREAFARLLETDATRRAAMLDSLAAREPAQAEELRELLRLHERAEQSQLDSALKNGFLDWLQAEQHLAPGSQLGPFRIVAELGRGGMGVVYRAERVDGTVEQAVAIKLTRWRSELIDLVRHEARFLLALGHPHIVRCFDVGRAASGALYVVTEWVEGQSLEQRLLNKQPVAASDLSRWARELAMALSYAHSRRVGHGDVKPSNVLIDADGGVRLIDFGISLLLGSEQGVQALGHTPGYVAPEVLAGADFTLAADVYAYGKTLERVLAACPMSRSMQADWLALVGRCSAIAAADRYASMALVQDDLARIESREVLSARGHETWHVLTRRARRAWLPLMLAAALVLGLGSAAAVLLSQQHALRQSLAEAERSQLTADRVVDFVLDTLAAAWSESGDPGNATVAEFVDAAERDLGALRMADAQAAARVALKFAVIDHGQERYQDALAQVEPELGSPLPNDLRAQLLIRKAEALRELGNLDEAAKVLAQLPVVSATETWRVRQAQARLMRSRGLPKESERLTLLTLADAAALSIEDRIAVLGELVVYRGEQGQLAAALAGLDEQRALILSSTNPERMVLGRNEQNRALLLSWLGEPERALEAVSRAEAIYRQRLQPSHSSHADLELIAIELERALGRWDEALPRAERALAIYRAQLGPTHRRVGTALTIAANVLWAMGDVKAAKARYQEALDVWGDEPAYAEDAAGARTSLCSLMASGGLAAEAIAVCQRAIADLESADSLSGQQAPQTLRAYGQARRALGESQAALQLLRQAYRSGKTQLPPDDLRWLGIALDWVLLEAEHGDVTTAEQGYREMRATLERVDWSRVPPPEATAMRNTQMAVVRALGMESEAGARSESSSAP